MKTLNRTARREQHRQMFINNASAVYVSKDGYKERAKKWKNFNNWVQVDFNVKPLTARYSLHWKLSQCSPNLEVPLYPSDQKLKQQCTLLFANVQGQNSKWTWIPLEQIISSILVQITCKTLLSGEKKKKILNITRALPKKKKPVHNNPPPHLYYIHPHPSIHPHPPTIKRKKELEVQCQVRKLKKYRRSQLTSK